MPAFAFAKPAETVGEVAEIADYWRCYGINHLTPQQQIARQRVMEMDNVLVEDDEQRKPHGSAEVIMDVSEAVQQFLLPSHAGTSSSTDPALVSVPLTSSVL